MQRDLDEVVTGKGVRSRVADDNALIEQLAIMMELRKSGVTHIGRNISERSQDGFAARPVDAEDRERSAAQRSGRRDNRVEVWPSSCHVAGLPGCRRHGW